MTIKRALPSMFYYLDNPKTPKSSNSIKFFFGHMKGHLTYTEAYLTNTENNI